MASRAGISNVTFFEMGFGDAARSSDPKLKDFDIVGIHGVYSWVKPEIRTAGGIYSKPPVVYQL